MTVFNRMDKEGLSEEVTFNQSPEGGRGETCGYLRGGVFQELRLFALMGALGRVWAEEEQDLT